MTVYVLIWAAASLLGMFAFAYAARGLRQRTARRSTEDTQEFDDH